MDRPKLDEMDSPKLCTTRLLDQNFGMCITPEDLILPLYNFHGTNYFRPWRLCTESDFVSTMYSAKDIFKITLDVQHFKPNEISVKVTDNEVLIEGKHEERKDNHGSISRQFMRRYNLPKDFPAETVTSTLSSDGVLIIMAKKKPTKDSKDGEKMVPIKICGPCPKIDGESNITNEMAKNSFIGVKKERTDFSKELKMMDQKELQPMDRKESQSVDKKESQATNKSKEQVIDKKEIQVQDKKDLQVQDKKELQVIDRSEEKQMAKNESQVQDKKQSHITLKEDHCRLLKQELLKDAVCDREKMIAESRREADELLKLISLDKSAQAASGNLESLEDALGKCKTVLAGLKEKVGESIIGSSEMSSMKSSTMSEMTESLETSSSMSTSSMSMSSVSSMKANSEKMSELLISELKEAAENI